MRQSLIGTAKCESSRADGKDDHFNKFALDMSSMIKVFLFKMNNENIIERWAPMPGYPSYSISTHGNVMHVYTTFSSKVTTFIHNERNYVCMFTDKPPVAVNIEHFVAKAFIPNPENLPGVRHINGDGLDDRVENLCWAPITPKYNRKCKKIGNTRGVYAHKNKWVARINVAHKSYHLGTYNTKKQAKLMYDLLSSAIQREVEDLQVELKQTRLK